MSSTSTIEWTDTTWNPVTGCTKVSSGCKFCYAEVMAKRLKAMGKHQYRNGFKLTLAPQELEKPRTWRKPRKVFVNSMSDLFHEDIPVEYIQQVFRVMNETPQHTYQILTKRSERLVELAKKVDWSGNIWMGVSVEHQGQGVRLNNLAWVPAKVKFASFEPLLTGIHKIPQGVLDWAIIGGESGHKARPIQAQWVRDLVALLNEREIPVFFKQWGTPKANPDQSDPTMQKGHPYYAKGGCQLDGQVWRNFPKA